MLGFFAAIYRHCLSLRYSVDIHGTHVLKSDKPLLILPNHIALVDPQILFMFLYRWVQPRPVIAEKYYNLPGLRFLFRAVGAISVTDINNSNASPEKLKQMLANISKALREGKSVVLYPSGQIAGQGKEVIFGKQSAWITVTDLPPEARVIGVRIRGLWGSMWSRAWIGKSPSFFRTFIKAILIILANGIFFVPKRAVSLEFEDITEAAKQHSEPGSKSFNAWLEAFYNQHGEERARFIPHFFYLPRSRRQLPRVIEGSLKEMLRSDEINESELSKTVLADIRRIIAKLREIPEQNIGAASHLVLDIGFDSLGMAELVAVIKQQFPESGNLPIKNLKTVGQLCLLAEGKINEQEPLKACDFKTQTAKNAQQIKIDKNTPIVRQIINMCLDQPESPFLYDAMFGTLTRKQFLRKAIILSKLLRKEIPEQRVGIMLPAASSSTLLVAACYFAGKVPVMFNWTVGSAAITHSVKTSGVRKILTAKTFYMVISDQLPAELSSHIVFLEHVISGAGVVSKASGLFQSFFPELFFRLQKKPTTAVILFTSGSEALPKTVPLSSTNLLADLWGTFEQLKVSDHEKILSFLPPFHSFGFTATVVLPLLTGIPTAYTPDPTDSNMIIRLLKHVRATVMLATPTFLKMILAQARRSDLDSLRLMISGAEACSAELVVKFNQLTNQQADFVEGYGITECSPVVSITPRSEQKKGSVGKLIKGLHGLAANPETLNPVPAGESGMIFVRGDSVFDGYLDEGSVEPFVMINGSYWYKTGDLGYFDEDGYLFLTGRLSRFLKIGGEMVSLPFLEQLLLKKFGTEDETVLAVEGDDRGEKPVIALFTTIEISLEQANQALHEGGAANLLRISRVQKVEQIPILGTGKTDYKVLKNQL